MFFPPGRSRRCRKFAEYEKNQGERSTILLHVTKSIMCYKKYNKFNRKKQPYNPNTSDILYDFHGSTFPELHTVLLTLYVPSTSRVLTFPVP